MGSLDYLLLLCIASSSFWAGFRLGSTVRSETKGIWMWCVPHPSKENHTLVLLDTEGLGDVEKVRQGIFFTPDTPLTNSISHLNSTFTAYSCKLQIQL